MTVSAAIVTDWAMMILLSIVSLSIFDSFLFYGYPERAGAFAPPAHLAFYCYDESCDTGYNRNDDCAYHVTDYFQFFFYRFLHLSYLHLLGWLYIIM